VDIYKEQKKEIGSIADPLNTIWETQEGETENMIENE
jgi:hypothetical protein